MSDHEKCIVKECVVFFEQNKSFKIEITFDKIQFPPVMVLDVGDTGLPNIDNFVAFE